MKVLDLCCRNNHTFEGWFGSEADFQDQLARGLVQCPLCADASIVKRLSAPRLNLGATEPPVQVGGKRDSCNLEAASGLPNSKQGDVHSDGQEFVQKWMEMTKKILANSEDVGNKFAEEARKIHYGESEARSIRGHTTQRDHDALLDEGIAVLPLLIPEALKNPLQ